MLHIHPSSWWSETYSIVEQGRALTEVNIRWSREAGAFKIDRSEYELGREGWVSGDFYLKHRGQQKATATKTSAWTRSFVVRHGGERFELEAPSAFCRTFHLKKAGRVVGTIKPLSWWTRKAVADLPMELPVETRVFITWLVLVMWKRSRESS